MPTRPRNGSWPGGALRGRARIPLALAAFPGAGAGAGVSRGGEPGEFPWCCADPVHLRPDRDRVMVFAGAHVMLSEGEATQVRDAFNAQFVADGLELHCFGGHLFLRLPTSPSALAGAGL
ncbi:MAG: hypothetical protein U5L11_06120 [Arhodomonas sp.]|nr:hypothetical protein [Arhodomonas sp.]